MPRECGPFHFALYLSANLFLEYLKKRFATVQTVGAGQPILPWGFEQLELWVGCLSYVDRDAVKLFEMVNKGDLEGLVVKRKDGKYKPADALGTKSYPESWHAEIFSTAVNSEGLDSIRLR